jgi:hypothetical protein
MISIVLLVFILVIIFYIQSIPTREFSCKFSKHLPYDDDRYVDIDSHVPDTFKDFYRSFEGSVRQTITSKDNRKFYVCDKNGYIHGKTDNGEEFHYTPTSLKCSGPLVDMLTADVTGAYLDSDGSTHVDVRNKDLNIGKNHDKIVKLLIRFRYNIDGIEAWFNKYNNYTFSWISIHKRFITFYYR